MIFEAGTDNKRFAEGIRGQFGDINAPTMFNAAFNTKQFWNGRAADLQEQAGGPPMNPIEMGSKDWDEICAKLAQDPELTAAFTVVYPDAGTARTLPMPLPNMKRRSSRRTAALTSG